MDRLRTSTTEETWFRFHPDTKDSNLQFSASRVSERFFLLPWHRTDSLFGWRSQKSHPSGSRVMIHDRFLNLHYPAQVSDAEKKAGLRWTLRKYLHTRMCRRGWLRFWDRDQRGADETNPGCLLFSFLLGGNVCTAKTGQLFICVCEDMSGALAVFMLCSSTGSVCIFPLHGDVHENDINKYKKQRVLSTFSARTLRTEQKRWTSLWLPEQGKLSNLV